MVFMALERQKTASKMIIPQAIEGNSLVKPPLIFKKYPLARMPKKIAATKKI